MGIGKHTGSAVRRVSTAAAALIIAAVGLIGSPAPAAASVHAVPWRFTTVRIDSSISGWNGAEPVKGWVLYCPAGYTAVSGGVVGGDEVLNLVRMLEWPDPSDGTYHIVLRNWGGNGTTVTLAANCVWLDDVGTVTTVSRYDFARNASGRAGGSLSCPVGTRVFSAGVDWDYYSLGRTIDFSTPLIDDGGYGAGWYVAGYSEHVGAHLGIELRCVESSLLDAEYVEAADTVVGPGYGTPKAVCTTGYRILTGGAAPPADQLNAGVDQGHAVSGPLDPRQWPAFGYKASGVSLRAMALCVPASTVAVSFTQVPPSLSTATSGTLSFSAVDAAGETVDAKCWVDGVETYGCASGYGFPYGPLADGQHTFSVAAHNQSGSSTVGYYTWWIDATVPVISGHTATGALSPTGSLSITFSEPVTGVTTSSLTVHAEAANVNISGTISRPTTSTAIWKPTSPLVSGETYRVSLTTAVHDDAGNPLTATFFNVRTWTTVENTSAVLERYWDRDSRTIASGGYYIIERLPGSRADLTFTATAGQTVSVYGIQLPYNGYADVYLDGVKKATPSFYAATPARVRVYLSGALTAGTHTISIRPLGTKPAASTGTWVALDNVAIGATVRQETSLKQYFRQVDTASAFGGSYEQVVQTTETDTTPARYRLTVVGTGFKVYATKSATSGTAKVYVDNVLKATINLNSASTLYKALVYSGTFALGQHVIRFEAVGTSSGNNSYVNLDRITIN